MLQTSYIFDIMEFDKHWDEIAFCLATINHW